MTPTLHLAIPWTLMPLPPIVEVKPLRLLELITVKMKGTVTRDAGCYKGVKAGSCEAQAAFGSALDALLGNCAKHFLAPVLLPLLRPIVDRFNFVHRGTGTGVVNGNINSNVYRTSKAYLTKVTSSNANGSAAMPSNLVLPPGKNSWCSKLGYSKMLCHLGPGSLVAPCVDAFKQSLVWKLGRVVRPLVGSLFMLTAERSLGLLN